MKRKLFYLIFLFPLLTSYIYGLDLSRNILFYPQISTNAAYAQGSLEHFAQNNNYKTSSSRLRLPVLVYLSDNIYAQAEYFVQADYNNNISGNAEYTYKFANAALNWQDNNLYLKLGRQQYTPQGKENIIYYGQYYHRDNALPSAVEGISHGADFGLFEYSALAAREVKSLSAYGDDSLVYGGQGNFKLSHFLSLDAFYYTRNKTQGQDFNLAVYGSGITFNVPERFLLSLYAAFNNGVQTVNRRGATMNYIYDGYSINGDLQVNTANDFAKNKYRFNVFYASASKDTSMPFTPISADTDKGFVFGGGNLLEDNSFAGGADSSISSAYEHAPNIMIYAFKINIAPVDYKQISFDLGVYNFISTASSAAYKNIGNEADISLTYCDGPFKLKFMYGLFVSGNGLASITGTDVPANKTVNKAGISASFDFNI